MADSNRTPHQQPWLPALSAGGAQTPNPHADDSRGPRTLDQRERDQVMVRFADRSCSLLVAIDITADPATPTHRTGRVDEEGWASKRSGRLSKNALIWRVTAASPGCGVMPLAPRAPAFRPCHRNQLWIHSTDSNQSSRHHVTPSSMGNTNEFFQNNPITHFI